MLRWADGAEHYGAIAHMTEGVGGGGAWSQVDSSGSAPWSLSTANPATGSYHLRLADGSGAKFVRRIWGVAKQVVGAGYRFEVDSLPAYEGNVSGAGALVLADIRDVSNVSHFTIVLGTDGSIFATRGANLSEGLTTLGGTLLGPRSDPCVAPSGYHHFEFKAKIDNSVGYLEVRINQVTVLNLTGIDTQNTANASAAQWAAGRSNAFLHSTGCGNFDVDDIFAWDDDNSDATNTVVDFVGDKGCYYLKPNADTATADFIKTGSATSYGAIDDVPPNGTDYLDTAATTARTIVGVQALPGNVSEVIAFMPVIYAQKDESGPVTMRSGLVSGSSETYGYNDDPSTSYAYLRPAPKTIDPATGVAWANTAAPKLLIERTA